MPLLLWTTLNLRGGSAWTAHGAGIPLPPRALRN
jgi:hypothetical protein